MRRLTVAAVLSLLILGCSKVSSTARWEKSAASSEVGYEDSLQTLRLPSNVATKEMRAPSRPAPEVAPRKIIYTGGIELLVSSFSEADSQLDDLVKKYHGLVAQSEITSTPGSPRSGNWRVRIPVDRFSEFVNQLTKLGEALKNKTDSDDITEKYFDFQVRIENKQIQVDRIQKIIKEQTGKISDVLEAERELGRVTTELEELKGSVKLWDNQTSLATVNITLHERNRFVPPESPTFSDSVSRTFAGSVSTLIGFLQAVVLGVVAFAPWIPVVVLISVPCWLILRRAGQRTP